MILLAWLTEIGLITWRDLTSTANKQTHTINGLPLPADYLATFLIFGTLGMAPKDNPGAYRAAALTAWAFVIASYVNALPSVLNPSGAAKSTGTSTATPTPSTTIQPGG